METLEQAANRYIETTDGIDKDIKTAFMDGARWMIDNRQPEQVKMKFSDRFLIWLAIGVLAVALLITILNL